MSIPGLLPPKELNGKLLVDGGITDNLPIEVVRNMGADIIIAVDISNDFKKRDELNNYFAVMDQLTDFMVRDNADRQISLLTNDDFLIRPNIRGIKTADFARMPLAFESGYVEVMAMADELTHLDGRGRAQMVDVADKAVTRRVCVARGELRMAPETLAKIAQGRVPKGDVLATARIAGIQAAKRTDEWIPLCHSLPLDGVEIELLPDPERSRIAIEARVQAQARTGVEMEALVAVSAAGLTIYDMCKALDRDMTLEAVRLVRKSGGKSREWKRSGEPEALGARTPEPG